MIRCAAGPAPSLIQTWPLGASADLVSASASPDTSPGRSVAAPEEHVHRRTGYAADPASIQAARRTRPGALSRRAREARGAPPESLVSFTVEALPCTCACAAPVVWPSRTRVTRGARKLKM